MATESLVYEINEKGARVVRRRIEDIGTESGKTESMLSGMKAALAGVVTVATIKQIGSYADTFTSLQNLLRTTVKDTDQLAKTTNNLFTISQKTRAPLEAVTQLYQKGSIAANELGASQEELLTFTENVGLALAQQSGGAGQASGALLQLSQALGSGIVRAEEFNSILEGAFPIAQAAARGIDAAGGSVSKLRQLIVDGEITSKTFFDAILSQSESLETSFQKTVPTVSQGATVLRNAAIKAFGELDQGAGITRTLATLMIGLANNFDIVARAAIAAGIAISAVFVKKGIQSAIVGVKALGAAIAANPLGAIALGITAAVSALIAFSDKITLTSDGLVTLSGFASALFNGIKKSLSGFIRGVSTTFNTITAFLGKFFGDFDFSWESALNTVAKSMDLQIGVFKSAYSIIKNIFTQFPSVITDAFFSGLNAAIGLVEAFANTVIKILNKVGANIKPIEFKGLDNPAKNTLKKIGNEASTIINDAFNNGPIQNLVKNAFTDARKNALTSKPSTAISTQSNTTFDTSNVKGITPDIDVAKTASIQIQQISLAERILDSINSANSYFENEADALANLLKSDFISKADATLFLANTGSVDESILGFELYKSEYQRSLEEINVLRQNDLLNEEQATRAKIAANASYLQARLSTTQQALGQLSTLASSENKKAARVGKIAAISQATIDGFLAVQKALASSPPPFNYGLAAATGLATAQNINNIRNQPTGFRTGGSFTVGGSGGPDSQLVPIMATPGEQVSISTPNQVRRGDPNQNQNGDSRKIIVANFMSEKSMREYLDSEAFDEVYINKIEANATSVKQILESA